MPGRVRAALCAAVLVVMLPVAREPHAPHVSTWLVKPAQGVMRAPAPFRLVALTWPSSSRPPASVAVRTSNDARSWTPWTPLEVDGQEAPERSPTGGTSPLWVG